MTDYEKEQAKLRVKYELQRLTSALKQSLGNKRYMDSIQSLLFRIEEATPEEFEAIRYLINDIQSLRHDLDREKKKFF